MKAVEPGLVEIEGGTFRMGSDDFYPEEGPVVEVHVDSFRLARHAVTNEQFAAFVADAGYITTAERPLDPASFPDGTLESLEPGSLVFTPTTAPVDLRDWRQWWRWVPGASWRHPFGPDSSIEGRDGHPVVQVSFEDANAYAEWAGLRLPTEAEWEYAARGGLDGATYVWGEEPNDGTRANTWQGRFPYLNEGAQGWVGTAPTGSFPPNGFGLHEMTGNTWEWTSDVWTDRHQPRPATALPLASSCGCGPAAPEGGGDASVRVLKGGSHLCSPEYCLRYRPAARSPQSTDSATTHIGFRCAG
ncbi:Formylglycine-generating enzyme, required for sulfatase activity, contains SUMF1/FGE domain [Nocardioides terrae]|uniref:Formylglycine-generating enzyme, required for sulfatase activity, contains SUMF1/FGE domain n=1 Tax=Nocardioides terrae TaxID=574651 RepID=A0A1I1KDH8_9ACTN|nr:formylglycine-generating enzyme family protein [Nocardioides terrae]SFC58651.1 Formylglycine-generating enzyme, required for sulfatase activity, contains SUMF1/FGE domain [Nocardioides terrae]